MGKEMEISYFKSKSKSSETEVARETTLSRVLGVALVCLLWGCGNSNRYLDWKETEIT